MDSNKLLMWTPHEIFNAEHTYIYIQRNGIISWHAEHMQTCLDQVRIYFFFLFFFSFRAEKKKKPCN